MNVAPRCVHRAVRGVYYKSTRHRDVVESGSNVSCNHRL